MRTGGFMSTTPADDEPTAPTQVGAVVPGFPFVTVGAPVRVGDYLVIERLGAGGMGAVFLAEDVLLLRKVAIKAMLPDLAADAPNRERFLREARAAAAVEHDNVVPILHVGAAPDGTPFIVMPFLKGESLDDRLKREGVAPTELVLKVAREVADGLAAAHAVGLIHRDIKPANIWLAADPAAPGQVHRCQVLDFGLARPVAAPGASELTARGAIVGTPAYMPAEQARGDVLDARADLYSLGVTLYRAATGALPFNGTTPMAVLLALTTDTAPPVGTLAPHLPRALARLIDRLMRKPAGERPQSAAEVAAEVRKIEAAYQSRAPHLVEVTNLPNLPASGLSASAAQLVPAALADQDTAPDDAEPLDLPPAPPKRNRAPLLIGAAVAALALVALGVWQLTKPRADARSPDVVKKEEPKPNPPKPGDGPPKATDPDRAAAEYIVSVGSAAFINAEPREYRTRAELPGEPFRVSYVDLAGNKKVTDEGLANFRDCKHLTEMYLMDTAITNGGLAHIKGCPALEKLGLDGTQVSDAAIAHLKECHGLTRLTLSRTQVTEGGIAELRKALPRCDVQWQSAPPPPVAADPDRAAALYVLSLNGCVSVNDDELEIGRAEILPKSQFRLTRAVLNEKAQVTDAALSAFRGCKHLFSVGLSYTKTGDTGIAHFKDCKGLQYLYLRNTDVTGAGLDALDCPQLQELDLSGAKAIGDSAVPHLKRFKNLNFLTLTDTGVTEKGAKELAAALPGCQIVWPGGTIKPTNN
jgi:serine/threonine protein kinase